MGQNLEKIGQHQSKEDLLYQSVISGNVDAIRALRSQGANLEWIDQKGRTPLIVACLNSELIEVAKTLIHLGADINAYRAGRHAGTPLHHAAKRGLEKTVKLLLTRGANALVSNDECQTPLDVARIRGHTTVVRLIENHVCYFSGWIREFHGPGFLEAIAPQLISRKIWVVVTPRSSSNSLRTPRSELAIYLSPTDPQPRTLISLWKAKIEEPRFHQSDPVLTIFDQSTKTRYKFASANEGDKLQLQWLYNACRGICQPSPEENNVQVPTGAASNQTAAEAAELAMAINGSLRSASEMGPPLVPNSNQNPEAVNVNGWGDPVPVEIDNGWSHTVRPQSEASSSGWMDEPEKDNYNGWGPTTSKPTGSEPSKEDYNGWGVPASEPASNKLAEEKHNRWGIRPFKPIFYAHTKESHTGWRGSTSKPIGNKHANEDNNAWDPTTSEPVSDAPSVIQPDNRASAVNSIAPSAPPIPDELLGEGQVYYPQVDLSPVDVPVPAMESQTSKKTGAKDDESGSDSSSCVICWEAPIEGACVPCGHMVGCMSCLTEIEAKKGVCPVCRTHIEKVLRLFAV